MNRPKLGLATGGLLALALAVLPAATAGAMVAAPTVGAAGLAATEQARAAASATALGLGSGEQLTVRSVTTDPDGSTHVRYDRTYHGLRVIGGDLVSHRTAAGAVKAVTWNVRKAVAPPSTTPKVARSAAREAGLRASTASNESVSAGELVVYQAASGPRLAYEVVTEGVAADQTPTRLHTVVDATTGATLASWDDIKHGTGKSLFVGTVPLGTTAGTGSFTMRDAHGNYTTDLGNRTTGTGTTFTDADDVWGNGTTSDRASAGVDAHFGAGKTYDYYSTVLGRAGIWNTGAGARSRVHYGTNYSNAFWDGTQMTYGDGANNAAPLVELDVAGHEMSHGVTENTANLTYSGESGGLNEATSDIFGTAVEFYANNPADVPDYFIGEKLNLNGNGTPLRYMDKPSKDGASRDCWSSTLGTLDVHYSSGPLNHWYYLASEGSGTKTVGGVTYTSPTCNGSTVGGIGHLKVEKIWYRALSTYLTSSSNYSAARTAAVRAAKDLYGAASPECTAIASAFSAISVAATAETCAATPPPTTGNWVANGGFESGAVSWTATSGAITSSASRPAHTGTWKLWLGGNGTTASESAQQSFTVPATATAPKLTYWLRVDTAETTTTTAYDKLTVSLGGTAVKTHSNLFTPKASYVQVSVDLTAYKGKTVTLKFAATEDASLQTSFVIDDVVAQG
ncbi:MAG TPA: M4 family metallopeptidase [Intrasporangium sp.]|uniref:M4 family metallopeptidase n=1 Tax=Intrasporangium sp. TaxID=1925024 RepID=UPI002D77391A|nr:M4 family metallopeptidase [Intrasporangium sp.]HET7399176.1 M4 family metallopeptidase [Intrasporangium sp.]